MRRKWQPTPVFWPEESPGRWRLVGYSPWGLKELDTTEWLHFHFHFMITGTSCIMACETCSFALTIKKENNAFKNQNEVTEIRNLECSHVATVGVISDTFLNHWNLNFLNCVNQPPAILKTSAWNCQLQPYGQKVFPCICATIWDPSQSLLNKHPYFFCQIQL